MRRPTITRAVVIAGIACLAACSGSNGPAGPAPQTNAPPIPSGASPLVAAMYQRLPGYITSALAENRALLPHNPRYAAQINAKITLLQRPTLAAEISNGRFYVEGTATSMSGQTIAMAALFAEEWMRAEAAESIRMLERVLPVLETFLDMPFPETIVRVWYGFKFGHTGGGGQLFLEDRTMYESRTPATRLPHDEILAHELAHSYISNESLTQFLEMYAYSRVNGATIDISSWTFAREYSAFAAGNQDSAALLDVYQLIGHAAMSRAYAAVVPLRPLYGEPLSSAARQVFVDQAPDPVKTQVAEKIGRITF
jgi:hypothetical protein